MSELAIVRDSGGLVRLDDGEITFHYNDHDPLFVRLWIESLKNALLSLPGEKTEFPVEHELLDGMYLRKLFIKKGSILVGKIHRKACMNIVAKGEISVLTETGSMRVSEGYTVISPSGIQKVGFAHADTIFINVFRTDKTNIQEIEDEIACESYEALSLPSEKVKEALCQ